LVCFMIENVFSQYSIYFDKRACCFTDWSHTLLFFVTGSKITIKGVKIHHNARIGAVSCT
jgi:hypothetical protein